MWKCEFFKSFRESAPDPVGALQRPRRRAGEALCYAQLVLLSKPHLRPFRILRTSAGPVSFSVIQPCARGWSYREKNIANNEMDILISFTVTHVFGVLAASCFVSCWTWVDLLINLNSFLFQLSWDFEWTSSCWNVFSLGILVVFTSIVSVNLVFGNEQRRENRDTNDFFKT